MSENSQFELLGQRRFGPYFLTQILGALNDNVLRQGLLVLIAFQGASIAGLEPAALSQASAALFLLPYFLFSAIAGQLADKVEKSLLIQRIKLFEIGLMALAGIALASGSTAFLLCLLFLMGLQSTLFGPVKFSILPQVLDRSELVGGNALVEGATYLAIIAGLLVGGTAIAVEGSGPMLLAACLLGLAILGYLASRFIPEVAAPAPGLELKWNPLPESLRIIRHARRERSVFLSILGVSWFWAFGVVALTQIPSYVSEVLRGGPAVANCLVVAFAVGVGGGSLLCERLSGKRIELGLVPLGSIGLSVFALDLYFAQPAAAATAVETVGEFLARPGTWRILADHALIGVAGGVYSVPLYAMMQDRSDLEHRSRIIAANNILNSLFMVLAVAVAVGFLQLGATIPQLFLLLAAVNAAVAVYIYTLLPEFLMRFLVWVLIRTLYRVRTHGLEHIPETGAAVLVCNHVSFVDALIIGGSVRRPVRFVMYYKIFQIPLLAFIFRTAKAIPIAGRREDPEMLDAAYDQIAAELEAGNLVCIFPEGAITRDGDIQPFRRGIERIVERTPVPVVPMALHGLWGSWFSREGGGAVRKLPRRLRARIELIAHRPVPAARVTAEGLETIVRALRGEQ